MRRIDHATAKGTRNTAAAPGSEGFWTKGDPQAPEAATILDEDWFNDLDACLENIRDAGGVTGTKGTGGDDDLLDAIRAIVGNVLGPGYRSGLELSIGTDTDHEIDIAPGAILDSTGAQSLRITTQQTIDIENAGEGGLFTGTVANNTWYHVFLIKKDSDGSISEGFDISAVAANIPSGFTEFALVESVRTDGSANIIAFKNRSGRMAWDVPVNDVDNTNPGTSAITDALTTPEDREVNALVAFGYITGNSATASQSLLTALDLANTVPTVSLCNVQYGSSNGRSGMVMMDVRTNTDRQVRHRTSAGDSNTRVGIVTFGWSA